MSWWDYIIDKIKDSINPDPPTNPGPDRQHDAPLEPDPEDPHNIVPESPGPGGIREPGTRPHYPDDDQPASPPKPPDEQAPENDEPKTADTPDNLLPGGVGTEENTGKGMTD
jgi:hypothetical protein